MSEKNTKADTFIEFSHTIEDNEAGFRACLVITLSDDGLTIGHEFGSMIGMTSTTLQGIVTIDVLKQVLETCLSQSKADAITFKVELHEYDEETREMSAIEDDFQISISGPIDFSPFLLKLLPAIIRMAEALEKSPEPVMNTLAAKPTVN
ncbi:MAG: hypothetical protein WCK01_05370 [Candidatus Uhrbacteria bacterium]